MIGPTLFTIAGFPIRTFGLGVALAFLLGLGLARRQAKLEKINPELVSDFTLYAVVAGVLGARLWEVAFTWENYAVNPIRVLAIWEGGLSIQGGVLGGILVGIWFAKKHQVSVWKFADIVAPGLILGMAIGRFGDFLTGDDFGIVSETFGVVYPPGTIAYQVNGPVPLVPTVLFESIADLLIMGVLLTLRKRKPYDGVLFLLMLIFYSVARFLLEFLRGDSLRTFFDLRTAQVASVVTVLIALGFMVGRKMQNKSRQAC
ncbi:prolipoprotein diacylglyceryl transferase [Effusibacillus consociatus]|uniref:Phosphatidylglycerol--prolipoprotein diacylglyceryl transferase n=1 Tax=Effusibacillus consociatus TaxID=1117041 RepID=A0ABV9Q7J5_9BACL